MHREVSRQAHLALHSSFSMTEQREDLLIDVEARTFLVSIAINSLARRQQEWRQKTNLNPDEAAYAAEIAHLLGASLEKILQANPTGETHDGHKIMLLIDVLDRIQASWCNIFPFCR